MDDSNYNLHTLLERFTTEKATLQNREAELSAELETTTGKIAVLEEDIRKVKELIAIADQRFPQTIEPSPPPRTPGKSRRYSAKPPTSASSDTSMPSDAEPAPLTPPEPTGQVTQPSPDAKPAEAEPTVTEGSEAQAKPPKKGQQEFGRPHVLAEKLLNSEFGDWPTNQPAPTLEEALANVFGEDWAARTLANIAISKQGGVTYAEDIAHESSVIRIALSKVAQNLRFLRGTGGLPPEQFAQVSPRLQRLYDIVRERGDAFEAVLLGWGIEIVGASH